MVDVHDSKKPLTFVKNFSIQSALAKSADLDNGFHVIRNSGLLIVSSLLNQEITLFRVFLNGLTVVSTTFSGNDSISSHVNGILVYFQTIKTQKNTVNKLTIKNHHSVKYENGEKPVRLSNCQSKRNNKVQIATLNNTNSITKYHENQSKTIKLIISNKNIQNKTNNT